MKTEGMETRVLIVEDDPTLLRVLLDSFLAQSFSVETAADGESALSLATRMTFDIIILDVMLPLVNGYEICRHLRAEGVKTPIIFLTAKGARSIF